MRPLIIPFFIPHAGCPHDCSFCNQRLIAHETSGLPQAEQIRATVREWAQRSPGRPVEVAFFGGSFTLLPSENQHRLLKAVQPLIDARQVDAIRISTRPDGLDDERLALLRIYRVRTIEIGVQSLDDEVLRQAGRGHTADQSLAALQRVRNAGFLVGAQLLPGLPGDSAEKALASLAGVIDAGAQFVRIYPAIVLAGTALATQYQHGLWQPWTLDAAVRVAARMLHLAQQRAVPVIRIGLQSDEGLVAGQTVLAGPWHPALGQLVRGELYYALAGKLARQLDGPVQRVSAHPLRLSDVAGHERRNLLRWHRHGLQIERVESDATLLPEEVMVQSCNQSRRGHIITDLNDKEICDA